MARPNSFPQGIPVPTKFYDSVHYVQKCLADNFQVSACLPIASRHDSGKIVTVTDCSFVGIGTSTL